MSTSAVTIARHPGYAGTETLIELLGKFNLTAQRTFGQEQFAIVNMTEEQKQAAREQSCGVLLVAPPVRNRGTSYELLGP